VGDFDSPPRRAPTPAVRRERGRWVSAVLIVAAIGATTLTVRHWPARVAAALPAATPLAARSLPIIDAPAGPAAASVSRIARSTWPTVPRASAEHQPDVPQTAAAVPELSPVEPSAPVVASADAGYAPSNPAPPLASRRISLPVAPPEVAFVEPSDEPQESAPGLVELPALAVTRAVIVAGRGIRTGLRATGAVFRAAF
jgi:hypothetical protein